MEMSKKTFGTQFITTTFRKELMEKADKFVGVKYGNHVTFLLLIGHIKCDVHPKNWEHFKQHFEPLTQSLLKNLTECRLLYFNNV